MNPIKQIRTAKKMTQQELSIKSEVPLSSIKQYETGKRNPKIEQLQKIADALEVSIDELLPCHITINGESTLPTNLLVALEQYKNNPNHVDYLRYMNDSEKKNQLISLIDFLDENFKEFENLYGRNKVMAALSIYDSIINNSTNTASNNKLISKLDEAILNNSKEGE